MKGALDTLLDKASGAVKADCRPEPVPSPLVTDLTLATVWSAMGGLVRGYWPARRSLNAADRETRLHALDDVVSGLPRGRR